MKTNTKQIVILPGQGLDDRTERLHSIELSIRTEGRDLMTNRLQRLLQSYGERLVVPNRLVLEILNDRNCKSRELKAKKRELNDYQEAFSQAVGLMVELYDSTCSLLDELIANCDDDHLLARLTEEIEGANDAIDVTEEFLSYVLDDSCDEECDCEEAQD